MRIFFLLFTLSASIFALTINESLLKVHSVLVPKLYLMDYKFQDKLKDNTITVALVYKDSQYKDAKSLKKQMDLKYIHGIRTYKVNPILVHYTQVQEQQANVYYLFPSNQSDIEKAIKQANSAKALTFSYLTDDLQYGVMISLNIANKIKPILNLSAIQTNNITLRPVLIDISSIYVHNPSSLLNQIKVRGFIEYRTYEV